MERFFPGYVGVKGVISDIFRLPAAFVYQTRLPEVSFPDARLQLFSSESNVTRRLCMLQSSWL
jgi:hypothetical protein